MEPSTIIITALRIGSNISLNDTRNKDIYSELKLRIGEELARKEKVKVTLADFEDDPLTYEKPLKKILIEEQVDKDENIVRLATRLLNLVKPQQGRGSYNILISGNVRGLAQGDSQTIITNFGNEYP